jgi:hypothetical protein
MDHTKPAVILANSYRSNDMLLHGHTALDLIPSSPVLRTMEGSFILSLTVFSTSRLKTTIKDPVVWKSGLFGRLQANYVGTY